MNEKSITDLTIETSYKMAMDTFYYNSTENYMEKADIKAAKSYLLDRWSYIVMLN